MQVLDADKKEIELRDMDEEDDNIVNVDALSRVAREQAAKKAKEEAAKKREAEENDASKDDDAATDNDAE